MKIDNFSVDIHSKSIETSTNTTSFIDELRVENSKRSEELSSIDEEIEFIKQLQLEMINKLIALLSKKSHSSCKCSEFDSLKELQSFEQDSSMYRRLNIKQESVKTQSLEVNMHGFIQSTDKKIELNMDLFFSSKYVETNSIDETVFYDPLIINMDGKIPELDSLTFGFDIDMDGQSDQISMLKEGNGFLAYDRDDNGIIDDGLELFGTQNGNEFLDLKRYDSDKNNWIDENDSIFDKLRIWSKSKTGDSILALGEVGIGAIFLGYSAGQFDIRDELAVLGRVQSNGLYLNEDGSSGLISQIDFAKHKTKEFNNKPTSLSEILQA